MALRVEQRSKGLILSGIIYILMARYNRGLSLRPVHSEKHEVTWSNLAENASSTKTIDIVEAVAGEPSTPPQVQTGSTVKWIYFEFNLNGVDNSSGAQVFHWTIHKNPHGGITGDPILYDTNFKSQILKRGMEMLPDIPLGSGGTVQTKRTFTVKIPRKVFSRMGEGDKIQLLYRSSSASGINFCGFAIFKEFS